MSASAPLAIPELGLAYQIKTIVDGVHPGVIADNPPRVGDVIKDYRFTETVGGDDAQTRSWLSMSGKEMIWHLLGHTDETERTSNWLPRSKPLDEADWARHGNYLLRSARQITKIELKVERDKEIVDIVLTPAKDKTWPLADRGLLLTPDTRREVADHFYEAISLGLRDTWRSMKQVFQNLRGMITGRVSIDNLGGPVLIANVAYHIAGQDIWEFVFFLGLISVNLAVVNFLPIPVLDGGHMVFLIYEKLRGRQASEPVRVAATYAGLAVILSLFVFVMWNDLRRFFF
jgi:regulator of sigma E protease